MKSKQILISSLLLGTALTFLFSGCAGMQKRLTQVKEMDRVAVIQVSANESVEWAEEKEDTGGLGDMQKGIKAVKALKEGEGLMDALEEAAHSTEYIIDGSVYVLFKNIEKTGVIKVIPKDNVIENDVYIAAEEAAWSGGFNSAEGFRIIKTNDVATVGNVAQSLGVDGLLVIEVRFEKRLWTGVGESGTIKGSANVTARFIDKSGETLWSETSSQYSDEQIGIVGGAYDYDKMNKLLINAFDNSSKDLFVNLKKRFAKL